MGAITKVDGSFLEEASQGSVSAAVLHSLCASQFPENSFDVAFHLTVKPAGWMLSSITIRYTPKTGRPYEIALERNIRPKTLEEYAVEVERLVRDTLDKAFSDEEFRKLCKTSLTLL